jgi:peptidoglycan/xylan/chitin deacetylase (PgdA/CDA1 family)
MPAVVRECFRILKPGGVLLATVPAASRVCLEYGEEGDLWRMTPAGARALFEAAFEPAGIETTPYGSVLTNVAFLHGLACSELTEDEFEANDPYHPLVTGVRATKSTGRRRAGRHTGIVLLYHRIDDRPDVHDLSIPLALFDEQMEWLSRECRVMPLDEMLSGARAGLPERSVAVTFDDGYVDVLKCAAPILERRGVPGAVFATSRWLHEAGEYWWDILERVLLEGATPKELTIPAAGKGIRFPTDTPAGRRAAHDALHAQMVHASLDTRDAITSQIISWAAGVSDVRRRPLTGDELQQLARVPGIAIGAHTVNHLALPDQPPAVQEREILDSMKALEAVLGRPVELFAYPYGAVDRPTARLARASCRWAMSCEAGSIGSTFDAARIPRVDVKRWTAAELRSRLEAIWSEG